MSEALAVAVMHVSTYPGRREFLRNLQTGLGGLDVIHSQTTNFTIMDDPRRQGIRWNWARSWKALCLNARGATHGLVLSEDFAPAPDLLEAVNSLILLDGAGGGPATNPINLYQGRKSYTAKATAADSAWVTASDAYYGGCTVWPLDLAWEMIRWVEANIDPAFPHDDESQTIWTLCSGTSARNWIAVPSLLDHVGRGHSTVGHSAVLNGHGAAELATASALSYDWTRGLLDPPHASGHSVGNPAKREIARLGGIRAGL